MAALRTEIARHNERYYREARPEISDLEYDALARELAALEAAHPELAQVDSPVRQVGDDRTEGFAKVRHLVRMGSLDNTYNAAELREFDRRLRKLLGRDHLPYLVEPKVDGLAVSLTYEAGRIVRAVTRGNGEQGDDVTANVREAIPALPLELASSGPQAPDLLEIRGEIYMTLAEFTRLNEQRRVAGLELFANPRNLASGTLKQLEGVGGRRLEIVVYGLGACQPECFDQLSEFHEALRRWGLPMQAWTRRVQGIEAAWEAIEELDGLRESFPYATDGAVLKLDPLAWQAEAGTTSKAPRWAIAYKFAAAQATTRLRAISVQVGRTGTLTPVAELEPVQLAGTTVSRATLHNEDEIRRKDIRPGDTVRVQKAGEIIPQVLGVVLEARPANSQPFDFPQFLQELGFEAERVPGQAAWRLVAQDSPEQRRRQLQHFTSRNALDITHLGEAVVAQLLEHGLVQTPADLYALRPEQLLALDKFGEKSAQNLVAAITASKRQPLWRLIHALGIPHVGAQSAKLLAGEFGSLDALSAAEPEAIEAIDGIGPIMAEAIHAFFRIPEQEQLVQRLREAGLNFVEETAKASDAPVGDGPLAGKTFVLTGTLPSLSRPQATAIIEGLGGKVASSVSKNTFAVVAGEKAGSKLAKAEQLGVAIWSEAELLQAREAPTEAQQELF